ncbi:MAG: hypothetical protein K2X47_18555, partial [Bdellovibrionales bacterium]|nr:hypothetical protein [Bdellovibrionales bacterium]
SQTAFGNSALEFFRSVTSVIEVGGTVPSAKIIEMMNNLKGEIDAMKILASKVQSSGRFSDLAAHHIKIQEIFASNMGEIALRLESKVNLTGADLGLIERMMKEMGRIKNDGAELHVLSRVSSETPLLSNVTLGELFGKKVEPSLRGHELDGLTSVTRGPTGNVVARGPVEILEIKDFGNRSPSRIMTDIERSVKTTLEKSRVIQANLPTAVVKIKFVMVNGISSELKFRLMKKFPQATYHIEFFP